MAARPLDTFQQEGWYQPVRARAEHYYRPDPTDRHGMGDLALVTLCDKYASGGGIRPWLTPMARPHGKSCETCKHLIDMELMKPHDAGWFA